MDNEKDARIAQLENEVKALKEKLGTLIDILVRLGTELRNSRDRGAFHAGNFLGGAVEGLRDESAKKDE